MKSDERGCECEESRVRKMLQIWTKLLSKAVIAKHCHTLGYVNMTEENA